MSKRTLLIIVAPGIAGILIGLALGRLTWSGTDPASKPTGTGANARSSTTTANGESRRDSAADHSQASARAKAKAEADTLNPREARIEALVENGDFAKAVALIEGLGSSKARAAAYSRVFRRWASSDRQAAAAAALAVAVADEGSRVTALRAVGEEWAMTDPQAAFAWLSELPKQRFRRADRFYDPAGLIPATIRPGQFM